MIANQAPLSAVVEAVQCVSNILAHNRVQAGNVFRVGAVFGPVTRSQLDAGVAVSTVVNATFREGSIGNRRVIIDQRI